jgi:hypothetical protein
MIQHCGLMSMSWISLTTTALLSLHFSSSHHVLSASCLLKESQTKLHLFYSMHWEKHWKLLVLPIIYIYIGLKNKRKWGEESIGLSECRLRDDVFAVLFAQVVETFPFPHLTWLIPLTLTSHCSFRLNHRYSVLSAMNKRLELIHCLKHQTIKIIIFLWCKLVYLNSLLRRRSIKIIFM